MQLFLSSAEFALFECFFLAVNDIADVDAVARVLLLTQTYLAYFGFS